MNLHRNFFQILTAVQTTPTRHSGANYRYIYNIYML